MIWLASNCSHVFFSKGVFSTCWIQFFSHFELKHYLVHYTRSWPGRNSYCCGQDRVGITSWNEGHNLKPSIQGDHHVTPAFLQRYDLAIKLFVTQEGSRTSCQGKARGRWIRNLDTPHCFPSFFNLPRLTYINTSFVRTLFSCSFLFQGHSQHINKVFSESFFLWNAKLWKCWVKHNCSLLPYAVSSGARSFYRSST